MATYSISDLEQLTGIKAHTIRIWESRYNVLKPWRSPGNTRYYDDEQLRKLLNIASLYESGMKISKLSALSEADINRLIQARIEKTKSQEAGFEFFISQLIVAGLEYQEEEFMKNLEASESKHGLRLTYREVILPMLVRIGLMWGKDSLCPAQEHFISNLVRQKLDFATSQLPINNDSSDRWLLFLPENEEHELGLLFANYIIRANGKSTVYLGRRVPLDSLHAAIFDISPKNLLSFVVHQRAIETAKGYLSALTMKHESTNIYLAGSQKLRDSVSGSRVRLLHSIDELEQTLITHA